MDVFAYSSALYQVASTAVALRSWIVAASRLRHAHSSACCSLITSDQFSIASPAASQAQKHRSIAAFLSLCSQPRFVPWARDVSYGAAVPYLVRGRAMAAGGSSEHAPRHQPTQRLFRLDRLEASYPPQEVDVTISIACLCYQVYSKALL
ncbi:unnamed protein product [Laminaria digitata]